MANHNRFSFQDVFFDLGKEQELFMFIMLNAFSISLPTGERMFVTALHEHKSKVTDKTLLEAMKNFTRQESEHWLYHQRYNEALSLQRGYDLMKLEAPFVINQNVAINHCGKKYCLALTVCLEHITAIISKIFLSNDSVLAVLPVEVRHFWRWHATEEIEHRAVAIDVFDLLYPGERSYLRSIMEMAWPRLTKYLKVTARTMYSFEMAEAAQIEYSLAEMRCLNEQSELLKDFKYLLNKFFSENFHPSNEN